MNNSAIPLTPAQMTQIRQYGSALNYPAMYRYIADEIAGGRIAVAGGGNSDQYYWFDQAARINQNDTSSPASVYIRAAKGEHQGQVFHHHICPILD